MPVAINQSDLDPDDRPPEPGLQPHQKSDRDWWRAMRIGFSKRCPACGQTHLFTGFLTVRDQCTHCGTEWHHHRADDAPPYVTMFITGHVLFGGLLALEKAMQPPTWVHLAIWIPLTVLLSAWLLPRVKGAIIGLQWAHRMHGFGDGHDEASDAT